VASKGPIRSLDFKNFREHGLFVRGSLQVVVRIPHLYNGLQPSEMTTKGSIS
jgi:hypothetical protein